MWIKETYIIGFDSVREKAAIRNFERGNDMRDFVKAETANTVYYTRTKWLLGEENKDE